MCRIQSKKESKEKDDYKASTEEPSMSVVKDELTPQQDPLKWFGILVPQSLKQAQSSFKQGEV